MLGWNTNFAIISFIFSLLMVIINCVTLIQGLFYKDLSPLFKYKDYINSSESINDNEVDSSI